MKLLTKAIEIKLRKNSEVNQNADGKTQDFKPVVKMFTPDGAGTWLFTELDSDDILFGLCDLGMGMPELGYVSLAELRSVRGNLGLPIERDKWFKADKMLSEYAQEASNTQRINA